MSPVTVSQLTIAPVKGMRMQRTAQIQLGQGEVAGDRDFFVVDDDGRLLLSSRHPDLVRIEPAWDRARNELTLRFPDGDVVHGEPERGTAAVTRTYDGREVPGWIIPGPLSAALSSHLGQAVHLFRRAAGHIGNDDYPVTLMSETSLQALAGYFRGTVPDLRRFRMTIAVTGTGAWAEDGWSGHEVTIGSAALRVVSPVPRCVVTTRNPESGATDARILHALAELRGRDNINFGVWCDIARPGQVQVGDLLTPPAALAAS